MHNEDYHDLLETDYRIRLAEATPEKRATIQKFETVQQVFDQMNRLEYNSCRRFHRHTDPTPKPRKLTHRGYIQADTGDETFDPIIYLSPVSDEDEHLYLEDEETCEWIRSTLIKKPEWADAFIAVRIRGEKVRNYASRVGVSENNITQKLQRATKKLAEHYHERIA